MTNQKPTKTYDDEASLLLTSVTAAPAPSFSFGQGGGGRVPATKKMNVPTMRAMIVTFCFLLGTLAMIYSGSRGGSSNISSTANTGTVAVVTSDDSCATEVPGEGPCCDGHPLYDECHQVCDWLLKCDNGYVPELTDDTATVFPETSHYQPHNCHCRGYDDHDGCFCRQVRDMIIKFSNGGVTGGCDPCLPPPPTPSPTTRTVYDPSSDYCFNDNANTWKYCWYPTYNFPDPGPLQWGVKTGRDYCGLKCSKVQMYDPEQDACFSDDHNYDKFCWYDGGLPNPIDQWTQVTGPAYNANCGAQCTDICVISSEHPC